MKRKITRATIDEIRKEMPNLNDDEEKSVIGGQGGLYIISDDGRIVFSSNSSSDGVIIAIGSIDSGNIIRLPGDTQINQTPDGGYMITGSGINKDLFEYIAQNTSVEWALYGNSENGYIPGMNTSNHYRDVTIYGMPGCDTVYHNHEYNPNPSRADESGKGYYQNNYIYYEQDGTYHPY